MGRLFLVEFDQTNPEVNFYCCRLCQAHFALSQDCTGTGHGHGIFSNVSVNVLECPRGLEMMDSLVEDLYCVKCNMRLGWGYIESVIDFIAPNGGFFLNLDLLRFWDGILLRDAAALLPPVENQVG